VLLTLVVLRRGLAYSCKLSAPLHHFLESFIAFEKDLLFGPIKRVSYSEVESGEDRVPESHNSLKQAAIEAEAPLQHNLVQTSLRGKLYLKPEPERLLLRHFNMSRVVYLYQTIMKDFNSFPHGF